MTLFSSSLAIFPFLVAQVRIPSRLITIVNDINFLCQNNSGSSFNHVFREANMILQRTIGQSFHEQNSIWCSQFCSLPEMPLCNRLFPLEIQEDLMCNEENLKAIADTE